MVEERSWLDAFPPSGLVLLAIVAIQFGSGLATFMFSVLGPDGTVAVRIIFSAVILLLMARGRFRGLYHSFKQNTLILIAFGLCMSCMNYFFYLSISRIPLGAAVAFEFIGPLGVAALTSRLRSHFLWVAVAAFGIILLSPLSGNNVDSLGIIYALLAGAGWAFFIVLAAKLGKLVPGSDALTIAMLISALIMTPFFIPVVGTVLGSPYALLGGIALAVFSTALPLSFEFHALKSITPRRYGILISLEPAVAMLVGALLLGERIGPQGMLAVACVVVAAMGITVNENAQGDKP